MIRYGLNSRKRPPPLDILGGRLQEVRLYTEKFQVFFYTD